MAASPQWKLYDANKEYQACSKQIELLAACISLLGDGATIRHDHSFVCWTEGVDGIAAESYDVVALKCYERVQARNQAAYDKVHGRR